MARKKKRQMAPRRMRMTRHGRLSSARATAWVNRYVGKNIIKGYAKWFAVDLRCAIIGLRMLEMNITQEREALIIASMEARNAEKQRRKNAAAQFRRVDFYPDSDHTFAYIAGYTPGGVPYGLLWEELGKEPAWPEDKKDYEEGIFSLPKKKD